MINVQATVDLPSAKEVNKQIHALEKDISKLKVSGKFDNVPLKSLTNQLNMLKATVTTANFSPTALKELAEQVENALKDIEISNINLESLSNNAEKATQRIGKNMSAEIEKETAIVGRNAFKHQVEAWIRINSNAKEFHNRMYDILNQLNSVDNNTTFQKLKNDFREISNEAAATEENNKGFAKTLKNGVKSFIEYTFDSSAIMQIIDGIKNMGRAVYDIDTSMTNLYKVTNETESKYSEFLANSGKNAKDLGRNLSSTIEQSTNWAKFGFNIDDSIQLAKTSSIYSNIGKVDDDTAISDLFATMKAFDIEAENSISIVDKLSKLENEFTTSIRGLGDGLSSSASAMALGGNSLEKTLALLTGGSEITQDAGELGNTLKIGQMRILGMKDDLEKFGEKIDENVTSINKMQTQILNLTNGKVDIFDSNNNFREYYDILEDISKIYNDLSSTNRAALLETLFGKQRGNQGTALIQAFQSGQIQKALETAAHADGSAMQAQEQWMESLEAKTKQFEASFQSLSNTLIGSNLLKWFVDLGTNSVSAIDKIAVSLGSFRTIGIGAGLFAGMKNVGSPKMFGLIII